MHQTLSWSASACCLAAVVSCLSGSEPSAPAPAARAGPEQYAAVKREVLAEAFASPIGIGAREMASYPVPPPEEPAALVEILQPAYDADAARAVVSAPERGEEAVAAPVAPVVADLDVQSLLDESAVTVLRVCMDALASSFEQAVSAEPGQPFEVKLDAALEPAETVEVVSGDEMVTAKVGIQGEALQMIYSPLRLAAFEAGESTERPPLVMADGSLLIGGTIERERGVVKFCGGSLSYDGTGDVVIAEGTELCFDSVVYVYDGAEWVQKAESGR